MRKSTFLVGVLGGTVAVFGQQSCHVDSKLKCDESPVCSWQNNKCVMDASVLAGGNLVNVIKNLANKANVGKIQKQRDDGIKAQAGNAQNDKKYGGAMKRMAGFGSFGTSALFNPFAQMNNNNFAWMSGLGGFYNPVQALLLRNPTCPVKVPLCERNACQPDNLSLDQDAFACNQVRGCCFDMNLYLYQQMFPGIYSNVPTCHRAVKSELYNWYASQVVPGPLWLPEFSESLAAKLKLFDQQNPEQWGMMEQCPYNDFGVLQLSTRIFQKISSGTGSNSQAFGGSSFGGSTSNGGMNYMMMAALAGGDALGSLAQASMFGSNPLLAMLSMDKASDSTTLILKIINALSQDYGWPGIDKFECQMFGGCWTENRCVKAFDLNDWPDNNKFTQAVTQILTYDKDNSASSGSNSQNRNGMFGMTGMQGGSQSTMQMMMMAKLLGKDGGSSAQTAPSVSNVFSNYVNQHKYQQIQSLASENNPATCSLTQVAERKTCTAHTGGLIRDLTMCQVKGCCYDAQAWGAIDQLKQGSMSFGSRSNFGSSSSIPSFASASTSKPSFSSSASANQGGNIAGLFRSRGNHRGKRAVREKRSLRSSTFFQNPLLATVSEFCAWNNPLDGVAGLKSLQDVITPCCQRTFCYSAEEDYDGSWGTWQAWSSCSETCGWGQRTRTRVCYGNDCSKGMNNENSSCQQSACPRVRPSPVQYQSTNQNANQNYPSSYQKPTSNQQPGSYQQPNSFQQQFFPSNNGYQQANNFGFGNVGGFFG